MGPDGSGTETAGEARPLPFHGSSTPRGLHRVTRAAPGDRQGRYGRMFPELPPFSPSDRLVSVLADSMAPGPPVAMTPAADASPAGLEPGENPDIASGYTYVGQFVDHDITFDPVSSLERMNDPDALRSFRTPRFDLDSLYGSGPKDTPYLYDQEDVAKLLVGRNTSPAEEAEDLPRNQQGRAIIGDPRNDVHVIVTQLHLAMIRFHNAIVDHLRSQFRPEDEIPAEAQRLTRWHYQWVVVEDWLRRLAGSEVLDDVLVTDPATGSRRANLSLYHWERAPFIPVEFSAAAFRFGHTQVRATYRLTPDGRVLHILVPTLEPNPFEHLGGFRPLPKNWKIAWDLFFPIGGSAPQLSRRIDSRLAGPLCQLPPPLDPDRRSLALLNMLRARALGLPSGQAVSAFMGTDVPDVDLGLRGEVPLWYWLLKEAEVVTDGLRLGPTGARIVTEVLVGMLAGDPSSFLAVDPGWAPELPGEDPGTFTMPDLLRFAGVAPP